MNKAYVNYGIPLGETTYILLKSQKEKRGRKGQKAYLKKQWLRIYQIWGENWASKFMKLIIFPQISTPNDLLQYTL